MGDSRNFVIKLLWLFLPLFGCSVKTMLSLAKAFLKGTSLSLEEYLGC